MGRPPAVVIIVRHGARLDAADPQWHLTSPTPYDPPLTYGGWTQCRSLGARIAALLQTREVTYNREQRRHAGDGISSSVDRATTLRGRGKSPARSKQPLPRRKKHKVVLHSSPFVRCLQTSIAIAAGMSQYHGLQNDLQGASKRAKSVLQDPTSKGSPKTGTASRTTLQPIQDDDEDGETAPASKGSEGATKPPPKLRLRLDAFLGEWLTPEYYESITHPPDSVLMLAGAKSELLRRGEYVESPGIRTDSKKGYQPGMWGSPDLAPQRPTDRPTEELASLSLQSPSRLPARDRASTQGSMLNNRDIIEPAKDTSLNGYTPPTPRYAISPLDPIPKGYVAHARDACVDVDYQWDSTRPPHGWGDGGSYGEEWSSMHRRFRNGLQQMIHWYRIHQASAFRQTGHGRNLHPIHAEESEDEDTDTVLVLVTHGAGCNALIGALTDQPVLLDVGMASLTMAVYKEPPEEATDSTHNTHKPSSSLPSTLSTSTSLSTSYHLAITASVEHLRTSSSSNKNNNPNKANPLSIPLLSVPNAQLQADLPTSSPSLRPGPTRRRSSTNSSTIPRYRLSNSSLVTTSPIDTLPSSATATGENGLPSNSHWQARIGFGGLQRSASANVRSSTGLWAPPPVNTSEIGMNMGRHVGSGETNLGMENGGDIDKGSEKGKENEAPVQVRDTEQPPPPPPPPPTREVSRREEGVPRLGTTGAGSEIQATEEGMGSGKSGKQKEVQNEDSTMTASGGLKGSGSHDSDGQGNEDTLSGQKGLWRPPLRREVSERMEGPKRRWTVNDR